MTYVPETLEEFFNQVEVVVDYFKDKLFVESMKFQQKDLIQSIFETSV